MKKFVKFFLILNVCLYLVWVGSLSVFPVYFKGIDYISWDYKLNKLPLESFQDAVVILGDSTVEAGFNPSLVSSSEKIYNLALSGASPFDAYVFLKRLADKKIKPKKVFFIFSIYNYVLHEGIMQRNLNFGLYDFEEISEVIDWQRNNEFLYKDLKQFGNLSVYFPFSLFLNSDTLQGKLRMTYLEYFLTKARLSLIDYNRFKRVISKRVLIDDDEVKSITKDLQENNGHINYRPVPYDFNEYPLQVLRQNIFPLHSFSKHYLEKSLSLLKEAQIPIAMPYSPIPERYFRVFHDDFKDAFKAFHEDLKNRYGVEVDESIPWFPKEQLIDEIHLNPDGVKAYSTKINDRYF